MDGMIPITRTEFIQKGLSCSNNMMFKFLYIQPDEKDYSIYLLPPVEVVFLDAYFNMVRKRKEGKDENVSFREQFAHPLNNFTAYAEFDCSSGNFLPEFVGFQKSSADTIFKGVFIIKRPSLAQTLISSANFSMDNSLTDKDLTYLEGAFQNFLNKQ